MGGGSEKLVRGGVPGGGPGRAEESLEDRELPAPHLLENEQVVTQPVLGDGRPELRLAVAGSVGLSAALNVSSGSAPVGGVARSCTPA